MKERLMCHIVYDDKHFLYYDNRLMYHDSRNLYDDSQERMMTRQICMNDTPCRNDELPPLRR